MNSSERKRPPGVPRDRLSGPEGHRWIIPAAHAVKHVSIRQRLLRHGALSAGNNVLHGQQAVLLIPHVVKMRLDVGLSAPNKDDALVRRSHKLQCPARRPSLTIPAPRPRLRGRPLAPVKGGGHERSTVLPQPLPVE